MVAEPWRGRGVGDLTGWGAALWAGVFRLQLLAVLAVSAIAVVISASPARGATTCLVSNRNTWATNYEQPGGAGANCVYRTLITITNKAWVCNKPLALYGALPLKVVVHANGPWQGGTTAGEVILTDGCTGDTNTDTIDLIVYTDLTGAVLDPWGNGQDAVKYNGLVGPSNLQWTGEFQCGHQARGAHQDALQMQTTAGTVRLVNGKTGDWAKGASTCIGNGGATFYSSANRTFPKHPTDILGGEFVACNHGLFGGNDIHHGGSYPLQQTGTVDSAAYRTGRTDGTDPNCRTSNSGAIPCGGGNTLTLLNLDCQVWNKNTQTWKNK